MDAQYYVGDAALDRLADYAELAFHPEAAMSSALGTVYRSQWTKRRYLSACKRRIGHTLDDEVDEQPSRQGTLKARPIHTMAELADARYVEKSVTVTLREYVIESTRRTLGHLR